MCQHMRERNLHQCIKYFSLVSFIIFLDVHFMGKFMNCTFIYVILPCISPFISYSLITSKGIFYDLKLELPHPNKMILEQVLPSFGAVAEDLILPNDSFFTSQAWDYACQVSSTNFLVS